MLSGSRGDAASIFVANDVDVAAVTDIATITCGAIGADRNAPAAATVVDATDASSRRWYSCLELLPGLTTSSPTVGGNAPQGRNAEIGWRILGRLTCGGQVMGGAVAAATWNREN